MTDSHAAALTTDPVPGDHVSAGGMPEAPVGRTPDRQAAGRRGSDGAGIAALVVVQLCFGLLPVFGRTAMDAETGFAPFALAAWRIGVGALCLALLAWRVHPRDFVAARRDVVPLFGFAMLGIVLNQGLFLVGLQRSTPMNAGLVICLIPVFAYGVAVLSNKEAFQPRRGLGVAIALAGSIPLFVSRGAALASEHALGNGLMALNALCYAAYLVWSKPLLTRIPPLVFVAWVYLLSLPWLPLFAAGQDLAPAAASEFAWWSLAYVVVFPTIVAYSLNSFALARVDASTTAFFIYAQPLITAVAAWLVLGERLTAPLAVAGACLFAGMALVLDRPRRTTA